MRSKVIQACPHCGFQATTNHIMKCKGKALECDLCHLAIIDTYHAVYQHYLRIHDGVFGKLIGKIKPRSRHRKVVYGPDEIITLEVVVPQGDDRVHCIYHRPFREWKRLVRQGQEVWNTKNFDQLALACAIATFKLEYVEKQLP